MRKLASAIAAAALAGTALLGVGQAHAASAPTAPAATDTPAPSCVKGTGAVIFDRFVTVWMTNNCMTTQRVKPTWSLEMVPAPDCYELQPGQKAEFSRDKPFLGHRWQFQGLITC